MEPSTPQDPDGNQATDKDMLLICPVCDAPLSWGDRTCLCSQGHSFDLAREGYANLLLSHCRRSKDPGDSTEMVQARRRFLDSGAFARLSELIQNTIRELLAAGKASGSANIVDSGCGEGYFLGALQGITTGPAYGVDVSKPAIRLAARRYRHARWVIANIMRKMPFASRSIDVILSVLAPRNVAEFTRILKPSGSLVMVVPGPDHLLELRSRLMADTSPSQTKTDTAIKACEPHLALQQKKSITYEMLLNKDALADAVQMTPLFWRSTREAKADLAGLDELRVTMSFVLLTFACAE